MTKKISHESRVFKSDPWNHPRTAALLRKDVEKSLPSQDSSGNSMPHPHPEHTRELSFFPDETNQKEQEPEQKYYRVEQGGPIIKDRVPAKLEVPAELEKSGATPFLDDPSQPQVGPYAPPEIADDPSAPNYIASTDLSYDQQRKAPDLTLDEKKMLLDNIGPNDEGRENRKGIALKDEAITSDLLSPILEEIVTNQSTLESIREFPTTETVFVVPHGEEYPWVSPLIPQSYKLSKLGIEDVQIQRNLYGLVVSGKDPLKAWKEVKKEREDGLRASLPLLLRGRMAQSLEEELWHTTITSGTEILLYVDLKRAEGYVLVTHGASLIFPEIERLGSFTKTISEVHQGMLLDQKRVVRAFEGNFPILEEPIPVYDINKFLGATHREIITNPRYAVVMRLEDAANCPSGDAIPNSVLKHKPLPIAVYGGCWQTHQYLDDYSEKTGLLTHGFYHPFEEIFELVKLQKKKVENTGGKAYFHKKDKRLIVPQGWPVHLQALGSGRWQGIGTRSGITNADHFILPLFDDYWFRPQLKDQQEMDLLYEAICQGIDEELHPQLRENITNFYRRDADPTSSEKVGIKGLITKVLRKRNK